MLKLFNYHLPIKQKIGPMTFYDFVKDFDPNEFRKPNSKNSYFICNQKGCEFVDTYNRIES